MKRRQLLVYSVAALLITLLVLIGCGDTFRPVVNPLPQNGGVPATLKIATVLSNAGSGKYGVLSALDVSGDTNIGEIQVGHGPSGMAIGVGGEIVYVVNQTDSSISSIGGFIPNSVSPLTLSQSISNLPVGILCTLPPCAAGNPIVATDNELYIAQADPQGTHAGIVVASVSSVVFTGQLLVGSKASTATQLISVPGVNKVYSINSDNTGGIDLSSWNATNNTIVTPIINVGASAGPIKAVDNGAGNRLFVANQGNGTLSVIDTTSDEVINAGTDSAPNATPIAVGLHPTDIFLNDKTNQLLVANQGSNTVSIVNVAVPQGTPSSPNVNPNPAFGTVTTVTTVPSVCTPSDATFFPGSITGFKATNIVATPDGLRAFVLSLDSAGDACVFAINLLDNQASNTPVGAFKSPSYPYMFGISGDGTKIYVVGEWNSVFGPTNQHQANVFSFATGYSVINTGSASTVYSSFAPLSVPQQSDAIPNQIAMQP